MDKQLAKGDIAPDFTLPDPDGEPVSLSKLVSQHRWVLMVFLRHLG